jgi:uncharacterized damage-inducible protein DinB
MSLDTLSLMSIFEGWEGHQASLVNALAPLSQEQLTWRPAPHLRSAGQLAMHISFGRIGWFQRMNAPGSAELARAVALVSSEDAIAQDATELIRWLEDSWEMVEQTLTRWTVADLSESYRLTYKGKEYLISRQWTIWRILAHDLHHGGELAVTLGMQGVALPELGDLGGHITEPPLAKP